MGQGQFRDMPPLAQRTRQARLWAGDAGGDQGGLGGLVAAEFLCLAEHAPLATMADDAEQAGFRRVDVLGQHGKHDRGRLMVL